MGILFGKKKRKNSQARSSRISLTRFIGPGLTGAAILATLVTVFSGQIDLSKLDVLRGTVGIDQPSTNADVQPIDLKQLGQKSPDRIRVATFNIQRFDDKKSAQRDVMEALAQVIAQFDVVAIQGVQSVEMTPIRVLIEILNASGGRYDATVSAPLGREAYKESYAFVWDESRVRLTQEAYVVQDPSERMPREPMVASFEARSGNPDGRRPFRFTLINVHTSPDLVADNAIENEMDVLDDVFVRVRQYDYQTTGEEDCILLGDLNVDANHLRELGQIPGVETIAPNLKTNTLRTENHDHILIDRDMTREFTGRYGLVDLQQYFGINEEQSLMISDHMPVWAEFSAYESPHPETAKSDNMAIQPQLVR